MTDEYEFFSPEQVDEQIDQLFQNETYPRFTRPRARDTFQAEKRLARDLQDHYRTEKQEDIASLERAWKLVSPHLAATSERSHLMDKPSSSDKLKVSQERIRPVYKQNPEHSPQKKARRWFGMLAAVLVVAVLVGGLIAVLNLSNRAKTAGSLQPTATLQPTPTSQPIGTTVYTTPAGQGSYSGFSWSPDSKRIASFAGYGSNGLRIWDATTGGNAVTVSLPGQSEWITAMAWSPVSQDLALGTNGHLLIVDGQTGAILHTYTSSAATTGAFASPYLSSQIPHSGGYGYRALGWSPDGKYLAAAISFGASGSVQVWNIQTGTVSYTLSLGGSYVITSAAWSSDSQYLAVHGFNTQPLDMTAANDVVAVWNATTHREVFKKILMMDGSDAPVYWQPQSHTLAFSSTSNINQAFTLGLWDGLTGKELHKYKGIASSALAFSPDGQQLAYDGFIGKGISGSHVIMLMDISSGAYIYTYKEGDAGAMAWSPDGKYIVSASGGQMVMGKNGGTVIKNGQPETTPSYARVWIA